MLRFVFSIILILSSCKNDNRKIDDVNLQNENKLAYVDFIKTIPGQKKAVAGKASIEHKNLLFGLIDNSIYGYWKGTPWDFYGTTRVPGKGKIACGYFITNTLTDLGFNIQRVKLAQAASSKMIKELCVDVKYFSKFDDLEKYLGQQANNSVFIVGLDFHTGYILKGDNESYFLHSSYVKRKGVVKEKIGESLALKSSKTYMIGSMTGNNKLIGKWISVK